jgi:hypothetical protein
LFQKAPSEYSQDEKTLPWVATSVIMVKPKGFGPNTETSVDNDFQRSSEVVKPEVTALAEFQALVQVLVQAGITVNVFDPPAPELPDAVFPNNWLSTHPDGRVILYPMRAPNRRKERHPKITDFLKARYRVKEIIHLTGFEHIGHFLEGTGSLVFDHAARRVFAAISARTNPKLVKLLAKILDYEYFIFHTRHPYTGKPLYHTNVMLSIAPQLAIWIPAVVPDEWERNTLRAALHRKNRTVLELPAEALDSFAANVLMLRGRENLFLVASSSSRAFLDSQLPESVRGLFVSVPTIERIGGGSVRCMLCENFLELIAN